MGKAKEEERIEKIIRGLLKLPENRRCINCNCLGPQYVCTTFMTFVCTNCSGIHREFTHRVKSVSMAKFNAEEVNALQAGGNERAREIYLKDWDLQRHSHPDGSNLQKLREFIRHVYVDRRYTGARNYENLPRVKVGNSGSRSTNFEVPRNSERSSPGGRVGDRSIRYYYDERRSPRYSQEIRSGGYKRNPVRFEVVDDRVRDDRVGGGKQTERSRFSNGESKQVSRVPDTQGKVDKSSSPAVRPAKDILGENGPSLHVVEHPKANEGKDANASANIQKLTSSRSLGSIEGKPAEPKMVNSGSLIDMSTNLDCPDAAAMTQTRQAPASTNAGNLTSVEVSSKSSVSHAPKKNIFESLLSELVVPAVAPVGNISEGGLSSGNMSTSHPGGVSLISSSTNILALSSSGDSMLTSHAGGVSSTPHSVNTLALPNSSGSMLTSHAGGVSSSSSSMDMLALPNSSSSSTTASTMSSDSPSVNMLALPDSNRASTTASTISSTSPSVNMLALPYHNSGASITSSMTNDSMLLPSEGAPATTQVGQMPILANDSGHSMHKVLNQWKLPGMQQYAPSASPSVASSSTSQQISPLVGIEHNQPQRSSFPPNAEGHFSTSAAKSSQSISELEKGTSTSVGSQSPLMEAKSSGRKELPVDVFTSMYSSNPLPFPDWQNGSPYGMGFSLQYHPAAVIWPAFPNHGKSTNPFEFDFNDETTQAQVPEFPSMASLQEAQPSLSAPMGISRTTSLGIPPQLMQPQFPSYPSEVPAQSPYALAMPASAYARPQVPNNMLLPRLQGIGSSSSGDALFGFSNSSQLPTGRYSAPATPDSFPSLGRNPFG